MTFVNVVEATEVLAILGFGKNKKYVYSY